MSSSLSEQTDNIDKLFNYNIYLPTKTLYMGSVASGGDEDFNGNQEMGTDYQMAEYAIKGLHVLDQSQGPIRIILNNPGGDEYHGLAIYDAVQNCKRDVWIYVYGQAMSMGSIILQAGSWRAMSTNSRLMMHKGTWGIHDHPDNVNAWNKEGEKFDKWMEDLYLSCIKQVKPKFTREKLRQKMGSRDWILDANEAFEWGFIDEVL